MRRLEVWAFNRWCVRRFNRERGYDYPRWYRARRIRQIEAWVDSLPTEAPGLRRMFEEAQQRRGES